MVKSWRAKAWISGILLQVKSVEKWFSWRERVVSDRGIIIFAWKIFPFYDVLKMRKDISTEILQSWWTGCLISEDFFVKTFNHKKKDLKHWKYFPFAGFPFQFSGVRRWRNPLKKKKSYVFGIRLCIKL